MDQIETLERMCQAAEIMAGIIREQAKIIEQCGLVEGKAGDNIRADRQKAEELLQGIVYQAEAK